MSIKENIVTLCKERGSNITTLAFKLNMSQQNLSAQLNREYPNLETLYKIAEALEVPVSALLGETRPYIICPHCHKAVFFDVK